MLFVLLNFLNLLIAKIADLVSTIFISALVLTLFELVLPVEKQSLKSKLRGAFFWLVYIFFTAVLSIVVIQLLEKHPYQPLLHLDLSGYLHSPNVLHRLVALLLLPFIPPLVYDFFYYWFHRLQHSWSFLWRFHAVHHSIRELNSFNCNHHFLEEVFRIPLVLIPLKLLVTIKVGDVLPIIVLLKGGGLFIHSNLAFSFGKLRYWLADPPFHRIHHSQLEQHFDKNFAALFPMWDILFGTAYFPKKSEYPQTGLAEVNEPLSIKEFLIRPFVK